MLMGSLIRAPTAVEADDVSVVMRKTWITWKRKYEFWTKSSIRDWVATPA